PGTYHLQYSVFDDVIATFPFQVVQQESPTEGIVPGALDAALSKSTIAWLSFAEPLQRDPERPAAPVVVPRYEAHKEWPIWYGYAAVNRWKKGCEIVVLTPLPPAAPAEDMAVVTA